MALSYVLKTTLSQAFMMQRGTRLGDPLSLLVFILSIEPLAEYIAKKRD